MFNWFVKKINNRKGFTLIELVVVIAILGILAAVAVPRLSSQSQKAERSAVEANLRTIDGAISMWQANNSGVPDKSKLTNTESGTLQSWPKGPAGAEYSITAEGRAAVGGNVGGKNFETATVLSDTMWNEPPTGP